MVRQGWGVLLVVALSVPSLATAAEAGVAELQDRLQAQQEENARLRREHASLEDRLELLQSRIDRYRQELDEASAEDGSGEGREP